MKRDLTDIKRNLENKKNNEIIRKKDLLEKMFKEDPDLQEILGKKDPRPLNKYADPDHPTEEELEKRKEILSYNEKIQHKQIVPWLKLNGIQQEVLNFIMFEIDDIELARYNDRVIIQNLIIMCLVHEDDMETEYEVTRADMLAYLVQDILSWSNSLGMQLIPCASRTDIIDSKYYTRTLKFEIQSPNNIQGGGNKYDKFKV